MRSRADVRRRACSRPRSPRASTPPSGFGIWAGSSRTRRRAALPTRRCIRFQPPKTDPGTPSGGAGVRWVGAGSGEVLPGRCGFGLHGLPGLAGVRRRGVEVGLDALVKVGEVVPELVRGGPAPEPVADVDLVD